MTLRTLLRAAAPVAVATVALGGLTAAQASAKPGWSVADLYGPRAVHVLQGIAASGQEHGMGIGDTCGRWSFTTGTGRAGRLPRPQGSR